MGKPAQVSLLSALPVDISGTRLQASPFASRALGAVTSNRKAIMVISQQDLEKFALQPAQRQTPVLPHLAPSRKSSCEADGVNRKLLNRCSFESQ